MITLRVVHTDIGAAALKNEGAVMSQDPAEILASPQARRAHGLDQIRAGKQRNMDASLLAILALDPSHNLIQLVVEVVQNLDGG
jgi:hypothetical protein